MAVVNTGVIAKALQPGVNKWWGMGYGEHPLELTQIFDTESSEKKYEEDVQLVGTGLFPEKGEGAPLSYDTLRQGYIQRYTHVTFALGVQFTYEMLSDKQYDLGLKGARYVGFSARQTQENTGANVLNRAFNSSYTFADGKELCATDHPNISGGTFRNELATAADLSHASLEQAMIDIDDFKNDRGLNISVRGLRLIVPTALRFEARRILESTQESGTADNDANVLKNSVELSVNHYLTDADAWFIKTSCMDGMKRFTRETVGAPVRENDFDTRNIKYACFFRESYGATDVRGLFGSPGA